MKLRQYQTTAVEGVFSEWEKVNSTLGVAATGSGKTQIFCEVIRRRPGKAIILAHRKELVMQAVNRLKSFGLDAEIEQGELAASLNAWCSAPVVVATPQTLYTNGFARLKRFKPEEFQTIICDEAHHYSGAQAFESVVRHFKQNPDARILGVTATPDRADNIAMARIFDSVAFDIEIKDLIELGYLVPIEQQLVKIESLDFSECRMVAGDLNGGDLARVVEYERNLLGMADATLTSIGDRRTAVFAATVKQAERFKEIFNRHKPGCAGCVFGHTPPEERKEVLDDFSNGRIQICVNVGVLTEGYDDPGIEAVVMARATLSRSLYAQCLDSKTEVLTRNGWAGIDDDVSGDIACYDPKSELVLWMKGTRVERLLGSEPMCGIDSPHLDIRVTAGHQMLIESRHGRNKKWSDLKFRTASELSGHIRIPVSASRMPQEAGIDDCEISFLGMLLTDGNFNPHNNGITLMQSEKHPEVIAMIETTLFKCGFKFGHSVNTSPSNFGPRSPLHRWTISKGRPRGRDSHLDGWERLSAWVSNGKSLTPEFEKLSPRQVGVLLMAMQAGNGAKFIPEDWEKGTLDICFANARLASQVQSLAVRSGWRCNAARLDSNCPMLHLSQDSRWSLAIGNTDGRPIWRIMPSNPSDRVWCVSVPTGAIIIRRNGKVSIVGNCAGRGTRPLPGIVDGVAEDDPDARRKAIAASAKPTLMLLDFVGNSGRHKLVTSVDILGGDMSEQAKERAKKNIVAKRSGNMLDELQRAEAELREEEEARKRDGLKAKATFKLTYVDPFDMFKRQADKWNGYRQTRPLTPKQCLILSKAGWNPSDLTPEDGQKIITKLFAVTANQVRVLAKAGYPPGDIHKLNKWQASKIIDELAKNNWRRPKQEPLPF